MAQHKVKMENNKVILYGSLIRKGYDSRTKRLTLVMTVFNNTGKDKSYTDHPVIVFEGDMAEHLNSSVPLRREDGKPTLIEVEGHIAREQFMRKVEGERNLYERVWEQTIIGETLEVVDAVRSKNEVTIIGKVRNVWGNPAEGKRFYLITLEADGNIVTVVFFQRKMELDPQVGETLKCDADIHTRIVRRNGRRLSEFSVNAWRVTKIAPAPISADSEEKIG